MRLVLAGVAVVVLGALPVSACVTAIERTAETVGHEEQVRTLYVTAPASCNWTPAENSPWVEIVSRPASGGGYLIYRLLANPFGTGRGTLIEVDYYNNGPILSITQSAHPDPKPFRGDINGDGYTDGFWRKPNPVNYAQSSYGLWWGGPNQSAANSVQVITNAAYGHIAAQGDFRGDGHAGYALYEPNSRLVRIAFLDEDGVATVEEVHHVVSPAWELAGAGDFDGDGKSDLLFRNVEARLMSIWFLDGSTLLSAPLVDLYIVNNEWHIAGVADFDGDARADILMRNVLSGELSVWTMNGAEVVDAPLLATSKPLPWRVADVGDFDGDGDFDILFREPVSGTLEFHLMDGAELVDVVSVAVADRSADAEAIADVNGDGAEDVVLRRPRADERGFQSARTLAGASIDLSKGPFGLFESRYRRAPAAHDFNGDARSDLLLRNTADRSVATWELDGTNVLRNSAFAVVAPSWELVLSAPFSGDLMWDLHLRNGAYLSIWELAGQTVINSDEIDPALGPSVVGAGDFNGDGNADLLLRDGATNALETWYLAGHSVIGVSATGNTGGRQIIGVGDFDGDGIANVMLRDAGGQIPGWNFGSIDPSLAPFGMVDMESDGKHELVLIGSNQVHVYRHEEGELSIMGGAVVTIGADERLVGAGDYDADGRVEFVTRHVTTGVVSMWDKNADFGAYVKTPFAQVVSPEWVFTAMWNPSYNP